MCMTSFQISSHIIVTSHNERSGPIGVMTLLDVGVH